MKIEAGKFYKTRNGQKAYIYATNAPDSERPIHGYVVWSDGEIRLYSWTALGGFWDNGDKPGKYGPDLISEWVEPAKKLYAYLGAQSQVFMYEENNIHEVLDVKRLPHLDTPEEK